jgi:uncharacterized protein YbbC (DUF1343 family)
MTGKNHESTSCGVRVSIDGFFSIRPIKLNLRMAAFSLLILTFFFSATEAQKVLNGIDVLERDNFSLLAGKRIGLITNQTGVNKDLVSTLDLFKRARNFKLTAVFSPEHGLKGDIGSGQFYGDSKDSAAGIGYFSLYGKTQKPTREMLSRIDILVYDIQDIGVRSYTYISTMGLAMEAAAENNIEFVVLDRPNPLGGLRIEGNIVEDEFTSFVGKYKIPYVYGLTCGELASLLNGEKMLNGGVRCNLNVVKMEGWNRFMKFRATGLVWVPPSPNVPEPETPFYLVGTGILGELAVIGIGITYTLPFRTFAAEWIDADTLCRHMNNLHLPGVLFRPLSYTPLYGQWQDRTLNGVQIHITDFDSVNLMMLQFYLMQVQYKLYPDKNPFVFASTSRMKMFDKVCGTDRIRLKLTGSGFKASEIEPYLKKDVEKFRSLSIRYYLY